MRCPKCDTENPHQAKFCMNCAAALRLVYHQCGAELPAAASFCLNCSAPVTPPAPFDAPQPDRLSKRLQRLVPREYAERLVATQGQPHDERRTVTILFSDIKGYSTMAGKLDPEEVKEIVDGVFEFLIPPIYHYEGTLVQLMGDAILAFFGAPIAHEDDPERACRAALEIIAGAKEYAAKLEQERGISGFNVRVGINTGLVVVGEVGTDLRVAYTAVGDTINMAARMEQTAQPGTVLVTEETHRLIAPLFETEDLGRVAVKGHEQPMAVYRVLAPRPVGKVRGIAGLESPLVGREAEFAALQEALQRLKAGVGGIVTIVGEAGIGKSRLVAEVRKLATTAGWRDTPAGTIESGASSREILRPSGAHNDKAMPPQWMEGRCLSFGTSIAYLLWLDVLRGLLGVTVEQSPQEVRDRLAERVQALCPDRGEDVCPYLARLMSLPLAEQHEEFLQALSGDNLKAGTFAALQTVLHCAADEHPLVLVCEDLQWADPTSIELLEEALQLTDRTSLLLICVFRPLRERPSWRILEIAARDYEHRHLHIAMRPLSAENGAVLLSNLLRMPALMPTFQQRVLAHAEGNPFYVEEIVRSLIDDGALVRDAASGQWNAGQDLLDMAIPQTLQGVLTSRIDRLQEDSRRVLQMASVIGRIFHYRVLKAIATQEQQLDQHLLTLQREQMIRERARIPEREYAFKHELTREAAYGGLLKSERQTLHRQVAEALCRLSPALAEEQPGLLAYHWERSGDIQQALLYLQRAGDAARLAYAHQEAIDYYQRALKLLEGTGQHARAARTWMKLGLTYHTAFDFPRAEHACQAAFAAWRLPSPADAAPLAPAPHRLRVGILEPLTLDPGMPADLASITVISQLFSGLVGVTPQADVIPDVASSWAVSEDGRTYVFHLQPHVRWSDGTPVRAEDFEYAWKRVLAPASASPNASMLYDIQGARAYHQGLAGSSDAIAVRALDEHTLQVELQEPVAYFLQLLAFPAFFPFPRHAADAQASSQSCTGELPTNGPFTLESWQRGLRATLARNPQYRGLPEGNAEQVELVFIPNGPCPEALAMYDADQLDICHLGTVPPIDLNLLRHHYADDYVSDPTGAVFFLVFDVSRAPFDDCRVRQAFAHSVNRSQLMTIMPGGGYSPASGGFVPPWMPGHTPEIALPYDPDVARRLLAEAGYPGGHGFPAVCMLTSARLQPFTQSLWAQWQDTLSVQVSWNVLQRSEYYDRVASDPPHIYWRSWVEDYPDPDSFLRIAVRQNTCFRHARFDTLIEQARGVTDQDRRMRLYRQADRILVEQAPIVPISYERGALLVKPWVTRFQAPWKDVIIEPHGGDGR